MAYIANARGTVARARHAKRQRASGGTTRRTGRWRRRPPSGATSWSCTAWTGTSGCCAAPTGACSGITPSARRSSRRRSCVDGVDVFGAWNGTVTALDLRTHRVRWRRSRRLQGHVLGGARRLDALPRRLLRPAARAAAGDGRLRWSRARGRPRLRHARRRRGPRLRPSSTRRLADGVLDERPLPLAPLDRLVRLLVAGGRRRPRLLRLVQRRVLRPVGARPAGRSGRTAPAARSPVPRSSSTGSRTPARSRTASSGSTRAAAASCSTSRTANTCPSRAAATACSCTATRGSTRSCSGEALATDRRRRRSCSRSSALGVAYYLHVKQQAATSRARRRSSSSPTESGRAAAARAGDRVADLRARRRAAAIRERHLARAAVSPRMDVPRAEPGRVPAGGRATAACSSRTTRGRCSRSARRTGKRAWRYVSHRCVAASPAVDRHVVYETFLNAPPCNRQPSAKLTGEVIAFAVGHGHVRLAARRSGRRSHRRSSSARRVYVGDWNGRVWALRRRTGRCAG